MQFEKRKRDTHENGAEIIQEFSCSWINKLKLGLYLDGNWHEGRRNFNPEKKTRRNDTKLGGKAQIHNTNANIWMIWKWDSLGSELKKSTENQQRLVFNFSSASKFNLNYGMKWVLLYVDSGAREAIKKRNGTVYNFS